MNIVVLGANGFIGSKLVNTLAQSSNNVFAVTRNFKKGIYFHKEIHTIEAGDFNEVGIDFWLQIFKDKDVIIDCSGKTPEKKQSKYDIKSCEQTITNITTAARESNIEHYIFLSSIKVLGEYTDIIPFSTYSNEKPVDVYAQSKFEAERKILQIFNKTNTNYSILRPSLVIGPGLKGNILFLIKIIDKFPILPLKNKTAKKSVVGLNNLISFVEMAIKNPLLYGKKIPISDENISIYDLSLKISKALNKKRYFFSIPKFINAILVSLSSRFLKLFSNLEVDSSFLKDNLNYSPRFSTEYEISRVVNRYRGVDE